MGSVRADDFVIGRDASQGDASNAPILGVIGDRGGSDHEIAGQEYSRLARRRAVDRLGEPDLLALEAAGDGQGAVAQLDRLRLAAQLQIPDADGARRELLARPDGHRVALGVLRQDVARLARGDPEAAPLADREVVLAAMTAQDAPRGIDDIAGAVSDPPVAGEERGTRRAREEAEILGIGLAGHRQPGLARERADLRLGEVPEREAQAGERRRRRRGEHVGLVLRAVLGEPQAAVAQPGIVAGGKGGSAEAVGEGDHGVQPDAAVAAHAGVRREPGGVLGQPRLDDPGAELLAEVEREVREVHAVRERARCAHGGGRAAGALGVVVGVRPELERHGCHVAPVASRQQRGDRAVDAAAHGDEHAVGAGSQRGVGADRLAERPVQRVGREVGRMELAGAEASQLGGDVRCADSGRVEDVRAVQELDGGGCGGQRGAASGGIERRLRDPLALHGDRDADEVAASRASRRAVVGAGGRGAPAARVAQVILEPLVHAPESKSGRWQPPSRARERGRARGRSRSRPGRGPAR